LKSERVVQHALDQASRSRTTICIAHRLSTIKNADKIVVVSRGEIVEEGTHSQLIALGGVYKGLVEAQRISADRKEGIEMGIAEVDLEEEALDELVREKSLHDADQLLLVKTKTGRSVASLETERQGFASAGRVQETYYSNFQLVKKVCCMTRELIVGS
jgi:ATP-binding cassette, subfamily B (MDR/TAP), member 1